MYKRWARELGVEADVVSLPGIGLFHGWRFDGKPLHLFNKALYHILKAAEEHKPTFIVVDLTHGVNYQTVAVLYAAVAASVLLGLEGNRGSILYNSEPYPTEYRAGACIASTQTGEGKREELPQLTILDVSQLQTAVRLIRQLAILRALSPTKIESIEAGPELCRRFRRVATSYLLLASGAAALLFPNAKYAAVEPELYKPGAGPGGLPKPDDQVEVDCENRVVKYGEADEAYPLAVALHYLERTLDSFYSDNLVDFLNKVADHYERNGVIILNKVLRFTADQLGNMAKAAEKLSDKGLLRRCGGAIRLTQIQAVALFENSAELQQQPNEETWIKALKEAEEYLSKEKERKISERNLRHLLAHGGYTHIAVEEVVIKEGKITEVTYNGEVVTQLIQLLRPPKCESR
ncbi:CRISPR-associated protein, MJ1666 family [Pyrobaculum oguniense TE7]|uniref:CRISPR-associated protein, MJ1666 family n=1 Tax=Pyrobaculum oguniense (strain DSM 13380 / JCM 10595 / TE7) TaxID=698757 RepID=H6QA38_PYROT|nr:CRISPR-associated protein, MJ1666 family [Pyrobaculum oguniense TE7]